MFMIFYHITFPILSKIKTSPTRLNNSKALKGLLTFLLSSGVVRFDLTQMRYLMLMVITYLNLRNVGMWT